MNVQFRTLTFYSRLEEQLQECLRPKKFRISHSSAIGTLVTPLGPHPESDIATTDLYSGSIPIAIMDEFGHQISFNSLKIQDLALSSDRGIELSFRTPSRK
jgi:hypothetical protein